MSEMSIEMSKPKRILFYIAIIMSSIAIMGDMVITPITYNLYNAFPKMTAAVNLIISGPPLLLVVASLVTTILCTKLSKKNILIIGGFIFTIGSVCGIILTNIAYIIFMRCLVGIGEGIVQVAAVAMIAEVYVDENKRATFMGIYNCLMSAIGAAMSALAGTLAVSDWVNAWKTYYAAIPMLIAFILFLPNIKPVVKKKDEQTQKTSNANKQPLGKHFWLLILTFFIFNFVYGTPMMYGSVYIAEHAIGNGSFAGIFSSIMTIGGCVTCAIFGATYRTFKGRSAILSYAVITIGIILLYFFPGKAVMLVAAALMGAAYGNGYSFAFTHAPVLVPENRISDACAIVTASYALCMFLTTFLIKGLMGILNTEMVTPVLFVPLILGIIITAIEFIVTSKKSVEKGI